MEWILGFSIAGSIMILFGIWTGYLAYKAKNNRFNLKKESDNYAIGTWKHFWYYGRYKMWFYVSFVLIFIGITLIIISTGVDPNSITTSNLI